MKKQFLRIVLFLIFISSLTIESTHADTLKKNSTSVQQKDTPVSKITVTGVVTDESGEALLGATVSVKNTANGVVTDEKGKFTLSVASNATLSVSYVGYTTQDIPVNGKKNFDVVLKENENVLDDVIVIGYGTQAKKDLTGSYSALSGNVISDKKTSQLSTALQGTMPGVMVQRTNGAPGTSSTIKIRGITTIGNTNPLIIVDGIYVPNIDDINPNDVESMTVLKDAASAAIYGSRAAAGVILITTKRGKSDKLALSYSFEYGINKPTASPKYVEVTRYMQMENELRWNDAGNGANEYPTHAKDVIDNYYALNKENPDEYPITDWEGMIMKSSAPRQTHTLNISGGTNVVRSNVSFVYDFEDGLYINREFNRITTRINNDFNISKVISASADIYFKRSMYTTPVSVPNELMRVMPAIYPAVWNNGGLADGKGGENPYGAVTYGGTNDQEFNQVGGKVSVDLKPLPGLKFSGAIAPKYNFNKAKKFTKKVNHNSKFNASEITGQINGHQQTNLLESRDDYRDITYLFTADYSATIHRHKFNVMAGYESFSSFTESLTAGRDAYELHEFPYLNVGPLTYRDNSGTASEIAYRSYFGRLSYNFKDRYLVQANIRADGSSRFHPDYRWGTFPSFSAGWNLSEESFMPKIPVLSFLKLRASWGVLGNDRIGNYPYQSMIAFNNGIFYQGDKAVALAGAALQKYAIQGITWETTESTNFGVNMSFFDNRLQLTGDYYTKKTKDMLLELEIPDYIGYENPDQNTGIMRTKGFDLEVSWRDKIGNLTYGISGNLSDFKSRMGDLGGIQFLGDQVKYEGSEFNEWYGYLSDGLYQTQEDLANSPKLNSNVKVGDIKYKDISGPDGVPDGKISPEYDKVLLGGSLPRYLYGANLYLEYKGFDLSVTLQGVGKETVRKDKMSQPLTANYKNIPEFIDGKYWSHYKTDEENLGAEYPRLSNTAASNNYILSDYWLFNGGYLRLKNINLGYSLPEKIVKSLFVKDLRFYVSLNDLYCFNNYPDGWDPEMSSVGSYPIVSSYIFGLSIKF